MRTAGTRSAVRPDGLARFVRKVPLGTEAPTRFRARQRTIRKVAFPSTKFTQLVSTWTVLAICQR